MTGTAQNTGTGSRVLDFVREHPLISGIVVLEAVLIVLGFGLDSVASPTSGDQLLAVVAGLALAYAFAIGVFSALLIGAWLIAQRL